jgi:hypothetical protein
MDNIKFNNIKSNSSGFGVIWSGTYHDHSVIIKMLSIITQQGTYYDKDNNIYYSNGKVVNPNKYYYNENEKPYLNKMFIHKRSISLNNFNIEVDNQKLLYKYKLAPKIYKSFTIKHNTFTYGFIVMDKWHTDVKEYIINNKSFINDTDLDLVYKTINKLHSLNLIHGDMKPNNIGLKLTNDNKIRKCCFFDCYTLKDIDQLTDNEKEDKKKKDFHTFKHYKLLL